VVKDLGPTATNADVILRMRRTLCDLSTGPCTVLANNYICLDRSAIKVVERIGKSGSRISNMREKFAPYA